MGSDSLSHQNDSFRNEEPAEQPALTRRQLLAVGAGAVGTAAGARVLAHGNSPDSARAGAATARMGAVDAPLSDASMTITGSSQGDFAGDKAGTKTIAIKGLSFNTNTPYDTSRFVVTGRRQHQPVTITKALGPSSPQIFQAAVAGEVLSSVIINLVKILKGAAKTYFRVTLTNAIIVDHTAYTSDTEQLHMAAFGLQELEDISFIYETIVVVDLVAKTSGSDKTTSAA